MTSPVNQDARRAFAKDFRSYTPQEARQWDRLNNKATKDHRLLWGIGGLQSLAHRWLHPVLLQPPRYVELLRVDCKREPEAHRRHHSLALPRRVQSSSFRETYG